jgi:hypothetical protein
MTRVRYYTPEELLQRLEPFDSAADFPDELRHALGGVEALGARFRAEGHLTCTGCDRALMAMTEVAGIVVVAATGGGHTAPVCAECDRHEESIIAEATALWASELADDEPESPLQ